MGTRHLENGSVASPRACSTFDSFRARSERNFTVRPSFTHLPATIGLLRNNEIVAAVLGYERVRDNFIRAQGGLIAARFLNLRSIEIKHFAAEFGRDRDEAMRCAVIAVARVRFSQTRSLSSKRFQPWPDGGGARSPLEPSARRVSRRVANQHRHPPRHPLLREMIYFVRPRWRTHRSPGSWRMSWRTAWNLDRPSSKHVASVAFSRMSVKNRQRPILYFGRDRARCPASARLQKAV